MSDGITALRVALAHNGWHPVPVTGPTHKGTDSPGKAPLMRAWQKDCLEAGDPEIAAWERRYADHTNTGILCGEAVGIDVDILDEELAEKIEVHARGRLGDTPLRRVGLPPKRLLVYRTDRPFQKLATGAFFKGGKKCMVEALASGEQFVAFGGHPSGRDYAWGADSPLEMAVSDLPTVTGGQVAAFLDECATIMRFAKATQADAGASAGPQRYAGRPLSSPPVQAWCGVAGNRPPPELVADALRFVPCGELDYLQWITIGHSLAAALGEDGGDLWVSWSDGYAQNDRATSARKWAGFNTCRSSHRTLFSWAERRGWKGWPSEDREGAPMNDARPGDPSTSAGPQANGAAGLEPLPYTVVSALAGVLPPVRPWCVPDWIPDQVMTLLAGDGGVGKSIAALQLHVACCVGRPWLGLPVDIRPSFYFSAEDPFDEVHRRVFEICAGMGVEVAALDKFAFCAYADEDAVLMAPGDRFPVVLRPTEVWERLVATCDAIGARLVTIDTAADTFGGDEIKRREVRAFVSLMNRHARAINGAVVMTSHPSLEGLRSGSGTSGSTGWNNSCRSRLYLTNPSAAKGIGDDGDEVQDPDARVLTRKKANFARVGESIELRWQAGVLVAINGPAGVDRAALNAKADRVFRELLRSTYAAGGWVSPNIAARNYAPSIFAKHRERDGLGKAAFEGAMHRLTRAGDIKPEGYGPPSDRRTRLAPA